MEEITEQGANLARIQHHLKNNEVCLISASRGEYDRVKNEKLTKALSKDLWKMGYGHIRIVGGYTEYKDTPNEMNVVEKSFVVINNNQKYDYPTEFARDMFMLCNKYQQETILLKAPGYPLAYYSGDGEKEGATFTDLSTDNIEEYWSKIHNNKFKLIESDDAEADYARHFQTFGTRVLRSMLYEKLLKGEFGELD